MTTGDIHVSVLIRGDERYIVMFDDDHQRDAFRCLGTWASNQLLEYTWWDAARQSKHIREQISEEQRPWRPR